MEMTTAKTIAVFAIIVGCFAVLYPKIFHPMLLHAIGSSPPRSPDNMVPQVPPHLRRPGQGARGGPQGDDFASHMRGGPHPGMRAAAEMKKQAAATQGSGKGMMSVVLPMYAVGIVIYLIYTMTKVFGGGKKTEEENKDYMQSHFKDGNGQGGKRRLMVDEDAVQPPPPNPKEKRKQQKDLERLLMKADKDKIMSDLQFTSNMARSGGGGFGLGSFFGGKQRNNRNPKLSELEMQQLKQRLLETEAQMSRILQAMETVAEKVEEQGTEQPDVETLLKSTKKSSPTDRPTKLSDASPDLDSYDFVHRSSAEQSPVMVEDLRAADRDRDRDRDLEGVDDGEEDGVDGDSEGEEREERDERVREEEESDVLDSDEEDIDNLELEYDPSPDEAEPEDYEDDEILEQEEQEQEQEYTATATAQKEEEEEPECTEEIIGQKEEVKEDKKEENPDLRKRQKQKHKVKRAD